MQSYSTRPSEPWKGAVAGAAAGFVGSWVMTRFHVALSGRGKTGSENPQSNKPVAGRDDAAMKAADLAAQAALDRPLTREEKTEIGGPAAHYALGITAGAAYGLLRETAPDSTFARGDSFGAGLFVLADQIGLPVAGLSPQPLKAFPLSVNVQHLASHIVYGLATSLTYSLVRRAL